ncbi:MFS transporter [Actinocatenispora comari]|uniref:MFS transporter n=1 Tax=Actinocatenispora comari TaxID=2807577 RepID=A0A8J4AGM2_9ACTN|nr:MFS transporter [Actinocatenispora comari]GIL30285.1 MFS transporter [Actinocatenispora comari]
MSIRTERATACRRGLLPLLVTGHGVDDLYQGSVAALVPYFVARYHWSYAAVSGLTLAATLISSAAQPAFGAATDRSPKPWLVPLGMGLAGVGIGLAGLPGSYLAIWLAVAASGLGVAAYHPESARLARLASAGSHVGMSWFSVGGNIGFALAPLLVAAVIGPLGLTGTPLLALPALACALVTALALRGHGRGRVAAATRTGRGGTDDWRQFGLLTAGIVARSVVTFSLGTFLALSVMARLHASHAVGEAALFTLYAAGAVGTLLGGRLARRMPRVRAMRVAAAASVPAVLAVAFLPGWAVFAAIAVAAIGLYVPFSLSVTLGQDYLPNRLGTASGVTLGLSMSLGGLAAPLLGLLADRTTLTTALAVLAGFAAILAITTALLREPALAVRDDPATT